MDLAHFAAEIARNVGREFPDPLVPWQEMTLRQLSSMAEEAIELDEILSAALRDPDELKGELADATITPYLVAHYAGIQLDPLIDTIEPVYDAPYRLVGKAMKAGRRYLGIARRRGTQEQLAFALARVVLAVRATAGLEGVNLNQAIADKLNVIFSRGWHEPITLCGACSESIIGPAWWHARLGVHLHDGRGCNVVKGEDVSGHCMQRVELPGAVEATR